MADKVLGGILQAAIILTDITVATRSPWDFSTGSGHRYGGGGGFGGGGHNYNDDRYDTFASQEIDDRDNETNTKGVVHQSVKKKKKEKNAQKGRRIRRRE